MAIPFTGGVSLSLFKEAYSVPALPQETTVLDNSYNPNAYAMAFGTPSGGRSLYLLHHGDKQTFSFPDQGTSANAPWTGGFTSQFLICGIDSGGNVLTDFVTLPPIGDANFPNVPATIFTAPTALPNPAIVETPQVLIVTVFGGVVGWRIRAVDSVTTIPYYALLYPDGAVLGWFAVPNTTPPFAATWIDAALVTHTWFSEPGSMTIGTLTYDVFGDEVWSGGPPISFSDPSAGDCLSPPNDQTAFAPAYPGWLIQSAQHPGCDVPYPQVTGGSPMFLFAADLSGYQELVFVATPGPSGLPMNAEGGYGPGWTTFDPFIVLRDSSGTWYYMQVNSIDPNIMDVYSDYSNQRVINGPIIINPTSLPFLPLPACAGEACVVF
jgi:hypothetical protein